MVSWRATEMRAQQLAVKYCGEACCRGKLGLAWDDIGMRVQTRLSFLIS